MSTIIMVFSLQALIDCPYVPHAVSGTQVAYAAAQYSSLSTILPLSQYFKILLWS